MSPRPPSVFLGLGAALLACARPAAAPAPEAPKGNLHAFGVAGRADPTEHGARVVPEAAQDDRTFGVEPGGGVRAIASGVRVINLPNGAVLAAEDRLPRTSSHTAVLPDRLGGGFLFVLPAPAGVGGTEVWHADRWLAPATPIFRSPFPVSSLAVGLDRVYLRAQNGAHLALDPRSGARMDLGPWPATSFVGSYAALDGWRAVAVTDLLGVVATSDAGATWKPLGLPLDPTEATPLADAGAVLVAGVDATRQRAWFEVRADGQVTRLPAAPAPSLAETAPKGTLSPAARPFGQRPLLAAIEDGWPLVDGTAVVARDGNLARIRLTDGALVDVAADAFPLRPARCHPLALPVQEAPGAFGFVCGEPRGRTVVYGYDSVHAHLVELRRFDAPRAVSASGNGALVVRGACAADAAADDGDATQQTYCLRDAAGAWRDVRVRGEIAGARVVALRDGRVAVISPPHGDLSTARLTLFDQARAITLPVVFTEVPADTAHALRVGTWLDGFEERRTGVLAGWVDAGGAVIGVQVRIDGHGRTGIYLRDAGSPMISGRYGLGWAASRRGYETVDGGMTWDSIDVPEPLASPQTVTVRACGPIGCTAAGWLRVGWGAPPPAPEPALPGSLMNGPPSVQPGYHRPPSPQLLCEVVVTPAPLHTPEPKPRTVLDELDPWRRHSPPPVDAPPFYAVPEPPVRPDEQALSVEATEPVERLARGAPLARLYAWGPKTGEWSHASKWVTRWLWPYAGSQDVRSSQTTLSPYASVDIARRAMGVGNVPTVAWTVGVGDDATHALLLARHVAPTETTVLELEADRAPLEVRRIDGEPFVEVHGAVRLGGHWYLATPQGTAELPATVVWQVDGAAAHELARVPRAALESHSPTARLARRADGRAVGLVVDGEPPADRSVPLRWVVPIDIESGGAGAPELLGASDLGDRSEVPPCNDDDGGWVLDTAWVSTAQLFLTPGAARSGAADGNLRNLYARLHLTRQHACLERLSGSFEPAVAGDLAAIAHPSLGRVEGPVVQVSATDGGRRFPLRCIRKP